MLIIPPEPLNWNEHTSLAANTGVWEGYVILPYEDNFQLSLHKRFYPQKSKPIDRYYPIALLKTKEQCKELFDSIVEAIKNGDKVFSVKEYLDKNVLKNADLPTV